ncbi:helix-turn-helix transcriptional regulator [Fertoebacter nigrum]|uniref:Helix-turn-helix transcriptional regulator n=1 Tax=Fertoeibacter niger TaxID=2656921 RepID=A0A8X8KPN3_9RHOB|nr:helix-turn-helix transcriptional regulator [Fertoeibacter niger]NUB45300.1 helix-turn-helix transcriptional regulator [Fertoeibacter niger]
MQSLPNSAETQLAQTIRRLGQNGFESALRDFLHRCLPFDNIIVMAYRDAGPPQALFRQADGPQVFAAMDTTYLAGAYLLDPYHDLHLARAPAGAYRLRDVAPDAFQRSRYFLDYYQQTTLIDEIGFVAYPVAGVSLNICLGRDASSGQNFAPREIETASRIAPIVTALAEAHWAGLVGQPGPAPDVPDQLTRAALAAHGIRLSQRQAEVALLILRGHSSVSIGLRLGVAAQTVKVFRKQLYARCGISSQAELFALMLPLLTGRG